MLHFLINTAQAVSLPNFSSTTDLPAFISSVYSFALTIVGIAVFIRILYAGFLMLTAAGNASKWGDAKTKIQNAIIGAILLFSAYLILYVINPDLVKNTFNFNLPPSSQAPSSAQTAVTPPTSGPAQIRGKPSANSAFLDKLVPIAKAAGVYSFDLRVVDVNGDSCSRTYSMEVLSQISSLGPGYKKVVVNKFGSVISNLFVVHAQSDCGSVNFETETIPDAFEEVEYYAEIQARGGRAPYAYFIADRELPPGLALTANTPPAAFLGSAFIPEAGTTPLPDGGAGGGTGFPSCVSNYPATIRVFVDSLDVRNIPATWGTIVGQYNNGDTFSAQGVVSGETVTLPPISGPQPQWWQRSDGNYVWSGGTVEKPCTVQAAPECLDYHDNDYDGKMDYPADPGCTDASDTTESSDSCDRFLPEMQQCLQAIGQLNNQTNYACINDQGLVPNACPATPGTLCGKYLYIVPWSGSSQIPAGFDCSTLGRQWHVYCSYSDPEGAANCGMPSSGPTCTSASESICGFGECAVSLTAQSNCPTY